MSPFRFGHLFAGLVAVALPVAATALGCQGRPVGPPIEHDAGAAGGDGGRVDAAGGAGGASGTGGSGGTGAATGTGGGVGASAGSGGNGARGGSGGNGARGGSGGMGAAGGCTPPLFAELTQFFVSGLGPVAPQVVGDRFYWGERDVMAFQGAGSSIHWSEAGDPTDHRFLFNFTPSGPWDFRAGADLVVRKNNWDPVQLVVNSTRDGGELARQTPVPIDMGPIAVGADSTAYFVWRPNMTPADHAVMSWRPPAAPVPVLTFADLAIDAATIVLLRVTDDRRVVLAAAQWQLWLADLAAPKQAAVPLFTATGYPVEITFSTAGMLLQFDSPSSSDVLAALAPGPPRNLAQELTLIPAPPGCSSIAHHKAGTGTLHGDRYVYEGQSGVFSVTITPSGLDGLTRLTALRLQSPRVTASGALFGVDCWTDQTKCRFMYAGRI